MILQQYRSFETFADGYEFPIAGHPARCGPHMPRRDKPINTQQTKTPTSFLQKKKLEKCLIHTLVRRYEVEYLNPSESVSLSDCKGGTAKLRALTGLIVVSLSCMPVKKHYLENCRPNERSSNTGILPCEAQQVLYATKVGRPDLSQQHKTEKKKLPVNQEEVLRTAVTAGMLVSTAPSSWSTAAHALQHDAPQRNVFPLIPLLFYTTHLSLPRVQHKIPKQYSKLAPVLCVWYIQPKASPP